MTEAETVADEEGFEEATPEEQAQYEDFVADGMEMIYGGGKVKPGIRKLLDEDPTDLKKALGDQELFKDFTPGVALAATAVVLVIELVRKSKPDDAVILHGGKALLEELATVSAEAGIHDFSEEEMNRSFFVALDLYREAAKAEGLIDEAGMANLAGEFEQVKSMAEETFAASQPQGPMGERAMMGGIGAKQ